MTIKFEKIIIRPVMVNQSETGTIFASAEQLPDQISQALKFYVKEVSISQERLIRTIINETPVAVWGEVPHAKWLGLVVLGADTVDAKSLYTPLDILADYTQEIYCGYKDKDKKEKLDINYALKPKISKLYGLGTVIFHGISVYKFGESFGIDTEDPRVLFMQGYPRNKNYLVDKALLIVAPNYFREIVSEQVGVPKIWTLKAAIVVTAGH